MEQKPINPLLTLPSAIIIAATIIAIAVIYVKNPTSTAGTQNVQNQPSLKANVPPVTSADHVYGNPNASIILVEYSDPSCPFCKMFDQTMNKVIDTYGPSGKVAWVYRHFPIDKPGTRPDGTALHPNAGHEAQSFECAASIGGNTKFWAYEKKFYETTPSVTSQTPKGLDQNELPNIAKAVGIDSKAFSDCLASGKFKVLVEKQYVDAINAGITGTPMTFIFTPSGNKIPLEGAQDFATIKSAIDALITAN